MRTVAEDLIEQNILDHIATYGWHVVHILGEDDLPPYSYTVGLYATFQKPEIILLGLPHETAHELLSLMVERLRQGDTFTSGEPTHGLIKGHPCIFMPVDTEHYHHYVGCARWYYEGNDFPLLQCCWPFKDGHMPWENGISAETTVTQPFLGKVASSR